MKLHKICCCIGFILGAKRVRRPEKKVLRETEENCFLNGVKHYLKNGYYKCWNYFMWGNFWRADFSESYLNKTLRGTWHMSNQELEFILGYLDARIHFAVLDQNEQWF